MKNPARYALFAILVIASFLTGTWVAWRGSPGKSTPGGRKILYWHDPMHPAYKSDKPGIAPDCGMQLEPVYADAGAAAPSEGSIRAPGTVQISPEMQQVVGVRVARVERSSGTRTLHTLGRVAADETRAYVINATVDGWITATLPNSTGSFVRKNEKLASFYSPEFLSAVQALLFALNSMDRVQSTGHENPAQKDQLTQFSINLQQYKDSLRNLGMGELQVQELIQTRKFTESVDITAPADGFILSRKVSTGLRFNKGDEMYRIADLSRIWILVDIFEHEEEFLRPGVHVRVTLPNQGTSVDSQVSNILPQFDPVSRTLKVRLEADNPGFRLRPDMFVDILLPMQYPATIVVPTEAVLDSGLRKTVFVDRGNGFFEPRRVDIGWRSGGLVEVTRGLKEGERVVVSGNFLLDSESRLKFAAAGLPEDAVQDPVCGMGVDSRKAGENKSVYRGQTYYFCNPECKAKFDREPAKYAQKNSEGGSRKAESRIEKAEGAGEAQVAGKTARDLVCGMDVDITVPGVLTAEYQGKTYYFCNPTCRESFLKDPPKYISK